MNCMNVGSSVILFVGGQCQNMHVLEGINHFLGLFCILKLDMGMFHGYVFHFCCSTFFHFILA
jgi:hypothetical protein